MFLLLLLASCPAWGQDEEIDYEAGDEVYEEIFEEPEGPSQQEQYLESEIEPKPFDRETWNKNRENMGYGQKPVEKKPKPKTKNDQPTGTGEAAKPIEAEQDSPSLFSGLGPLFQMLLIGGVIVLLGLLVFLIVKQGWLVGNKNIASTGGKAILLEDIEENLHESDLERALCMALEGNDYRMAIRIYYLTIIKELSSLQWIHWKRDKTNGQYVREMSERPNSGAFRQLTAAFERVWYSDEEIVKRHYEVLSPQFQSFINSLKKR